MDAMSGIVRGRNELQRVLVGLLRMPTLNRSSLRDDMYCIKGRTRLHNRQAGPTSDTKNKPWDTLEITQRKMTTEKRDKHSVPVGYIINLKTASKSPNCTARPTSVFPSFLFFRHEIFSTLSRNFCRIERRSAMPVNRIEVTQAHLTHP